MNTSRRTFLKAVPAAAGLPLRTAAGETTSSSTLMWYRQPAEEWMEALPIGNGRLGAMVFGGVESERLELNEDTLWSGPPPRDWNNPEAYKYLAEIRRLLLEEHNYAAANELTKKMQGPYNESYQPLGVLSLSFAGADGAASYRRELNLDTGIVTIAYRIGGVRFTREIFASAPDRVMVVRLTSDKPGSISFTVSMTTQLRGSTVTLGSNELAVKGKAPRHVDPNYLRDAPNPVVYDDAPGKGMYFEARVKLLTAGGKVSSAGDKLTVIGANGVTLLIAAGTGYKGFGKPPDGTPTQISGKCSTQLAAAQKKTYERILKDHVADHQSLFRRVSLNLETTAASAKPTDERLRLCGDNDEPQLVALYYQYSRYLLIASSRPGTQAANLQGIWNRDIRPPWSANYTLNINAQMNYWPAETGNLSECHAPLFDLIEDLTVTGKPTAKVYYDLGGWVAHHNADLWRQSPPVGDQSGDPVWANWPMGGAWLCEHLWEHYQFRRDPEFLRTRAYPALKGCAEFLLGWLIEDKQGRLITAPSVSPEMHYRLPGGKPLAVSIASTMDMAITWEVFTECIEAAKLLDTDAEFRARLDKSRARLFPFQIGKRGQLMEWSEDFEEPQPGFGHVSHLYPVYPGWQITPRISPELAKAAGVSLQGRIDHGAGHGGHWPCAWYINIWARLGEAEKAHQRVRSMLTESATPNLFNGNLKLFQIDGNFGGGAGIAEMLLQSHEGIIHFLPALPAAWSQGSFTGLCVRGAMEVDLTWKNSRAVSAELRPRLDGEHRLQPPRGQRIEAVRAGGIAVPLASDSGSVVKAVLRKGGRYGIEFS